MYKTHKIVLVLKERNGDHVKINQWRFFSIFFDGNKETTRLMWSNFQSSPTQHKSRLSFVKDKGVGWFTSYNLWLKITIEWVLSTRPLKWEAIWIRYTLRGSDSKGFLRSRSQNTNPLHPRKELTHSLKVAELSMRFNIFSWWVVRFMTLENLTSPPETQRLWLVLWIWLPTYCSYLHNKGWLLWYRLWS